MVVRSRLCKFFCSGEVGFLSEERRLNVAVTRARRHLVLIGDSETVSHVPFIKGMVEFCQERGDVWSAHDYLEGKFIIDGQFGMVMN